MDSFCVCCFVLLIFVEEGFPFFFLYFFYFYFYFFIDERQNHVLSFTHNTFTHDSCLLNYYVFINNNNNIMLVRKLEIDAKWQNYLEYLILKFKPVQTKAVMFVEYI